MCVCFLCEKARDVHRQSRSQKKAYTSHLRDGLDGITKHRLVPVLQIQVKVHVVRLSCEAKKIKGVDLN